MPLNLPRFRVFSTSPLPDSPATTVMSLSVVLLRALLHEAMHKVVIRMDNAKVLIFIICNLILFRILFNVSPVVR